MEETGLVAAFQLDGRGGGRRLDWAAVDGWQPDDGVLWIHLHRDSAATQQWLHERSGLAPLVVEALLAENTRPRCAPMDNGVMLFLRGVNLNPGSLPDDMVSIRLWVEATRIISVRLRRLLSVDDLQQSLDNGRGPADAGEFVVQLGERLVSRMAGVIADADDEVDSLQEQSLSAHSSALRSELIRLRGEIISLRRYLAPQRDALARMAQLKLPWLGETQTLHLREEADRVTRYVEDLDAARDRAALTQEELNNRLSEQMNGRMYVLSVVAALFLPLGFLTGLLGINVGGIPLSDDPRGFFDVVLVLLLITGALVWLFRRKRWL